MRLSNILSAALLGATSLAAAIPHHVEHWHRDIIRLSAKPVTSVALEDRVERRDNIDPNAIVEFTFRVPVKLGSSLTLHSLDSSDLQTGTTQKVGHTKAT